MSWVQQYLQYLLRTPRPVDHHLSCQSDQVRIPEVVDIGQLYAAVLASLLDQRTIVLLSTHARQIILHILACE